MDNNLYANLKQNLKNKFEGKCNKHGYIILLYKILEYAPDLLDPNDFSASAIYNVKFSCRICSPIVNTQIICYIAKITKQLILAINGPIMIIIHNRKINTQHFALDNNDNLQYIKDEKKTFVKTNDFIKINIIAVRSNKNDNKLQVYGYLDDIASDKEKESFDLDMVNNKIVV